MTASPPATTCYRHPDRVTGVRCQRCERPVCPACAVPAPVGVQCVECVRGARSRVISGRAVLAGARPTVTYALIAVNVVVWGAGVLVAMANGSLNGLFSGNVFLGIGALAAPPVAAGQWWRILTSAFLHSGALHLGMNMVSLFVLGPFLERALGWLRYAAVYLAALVAGSLGALILSPGTLTLGASGAIFGLLGAIIIGQRIGGVSSRASGLIPLLVLNLAFTFLVPGISIGAHLGGLAGGLIAGLLVFGRHRVASHAATATAAVLALGGACFVAALWVASNPVLGLI